MVYKIGICEDEKLHLKINALYVKEIINRNNFKAEVYAFLTGKKLLLYLAQKKLDLIFLDIDLGEESGIDIAVKIKERYPNIIIVFITGHREFANDAFDVEAMGYILKPIDENKMEKIIKKTLLFLKALSIKENHKNIVITVENLKRKLFEREIIYIERQQSKCIIFTKQKEYKVYETVTSLIERLSDDFLRVNQSFIVNMNEINYIKKNNIILKNDVNIPIGRTYKKYILDIYYKK